MKYVLVVKVMFLMASLSFGQGLDWEKGTWEEVLVKAKSENKIIFLDVYTTWCGPCLQMDKDVFPDSILSVYYNDHFISVKINAEDNAEGTVVAQRYQVKAYPTLIYLDTEGKVISSFVGMKNEHELMNLGRETSVLHEQFDFLKSVKSNVHGSYTKDELANILSITKIHTFPGKEHLTMSYLDQIESISEDDLTFVMGEISRMRLPYLKRLAPLTASLKTSDMYLRRNSQDWIDWKNNTLRAVFSNLDQYKSSNDLPQYEETLDILKGIDGIKARQIDNYYLDFYKHNSLTEYRTFATYVIDEYIIPTHPKEVRQADEKKFKLLNDEIMKDMQASFGSGISIHDVVGEKEVTETPTIDSLSEIYTISRNIADQLFDISGDFFAFYEDESAVRKASFWASLCYLYFPYDWKYYDNHIYILEASGQANEAQEVLRQAKSLPWYDEMRKRKSSSF